MTDLSPTPRTRLTREKERGVLDRAELLALLREGLIAHIGVTVTGDEGSHPVVLPVAYAVDQDGPDQDGTLYVHGSVAAGWLRRTPGATVCVTVTALDGLVLARSAFNHSMNYRCGVVIGPARLVEDADEKARALDLIADHVVPGPGRRAAAEHPQGARRDLGARRPAARGVAQDPRRRAGGRPAGHRRRLLGRAPAAADGRLGRRPGPRGAGRDPGPRAQAGRDRLPPIGSPRMTTGERTLVLLKPDAVRRGLVGEILGRFEAKGLTIVALEHRTISASVADAHYAEHVDKDFYPPLRDFVTSGPLVALVLEGDSAIEVVRAINGATDGRRAAPGTIRGDLSLSNRENLVHGSDSSESADREIGIWFPEI